MKRNKSGFTLIELLAVIVILAIIALIAVPVVMNIITKARKSAFKDTAYGIIKAGELYYADQLLDPVGMVEDKTFTFPEAEGLEVNGTKPSDGTVIVTTEGKVAIGVTDGKYCVTKGFEDADVTVTEDVENCQAMYTNGIMTSKNQCIAKGDTCTPTADGIVVTVKVNEERTEDFYVLADDGEKVTLILNRSLGDNVAWMSEDDYISNDNCIYKVCNEQGPITALTVLKTQTSTWANLPEITISEFEDTNNTPKTLSQSFTMYARLPRYEELNDIITANSGTMPTWLYIKLLGTGDDSTYGYWTSTADSSRASSGHSVRYNGVMRTDAVNIAGSHGVRPVIELSK